MHSVAKKTSEGCLAIKQLPQTDGLKNSVFLERGKIEKWDQLPMKHLLVTGACK